LVHGILNVSSELFFNFLITAISNHAITQKLLEAFHYHFPKHIAEGIFSYNNCDKSQADSEPDGMITLQTRLCFTSQQESGQRLMRWYKCS